LTGSGSQGETGGDRARGERPFLVYEEAPGFRPGPRIAHRARGWWGGDGVCVCV
jgi:hypothetical protein